MTDDPRRTFRAIAESLAFNTTEYDAFNSDIQKEIRLRLLRGQTKLALALATIKVEANKRLYHHNRAAAK